MTILDIKNLFEQEFANHFDKLSVISKDGQNSLCNFKNKFINFDEVAKEYEKSYKKIWATTDMIFFDLKRECIIFVEYKNGKIKSDHKPKIKQKFLDSFALLNMILGNIDKETFWHIKTYLIFVTNKDKNPDKVNHRAHLQSQNILDIQSQNILDILENNIILYELERFKPWYFNEIKTPFCDEFPMLMEKEFNIKLEPE